jgi:hypothetical protein
MERFRSAGILLFRTRSDGSDVEVLMQIEDNMGSRRCKYHAPPARTCPEGVGCSFLHIDTPALWPDEKPALRLNFIGGKRDSGEAQAWQTAVREFCEETKGLLTAGFVRRLLERGCATLDVPGFYTLFLAWDNARALTPQFFADFAARPRQPPLACATELLWVGLRDLCGAPPKWNDTLGYYITLKDPHGGATQRQVSISNLVWGTIQETVPLIQEFASAKPS